MVAPVAGRSGTSRHVSYAPPVALHLPLSKLQSGGFTPDMLTGLDPQALLGGFGSGGEPPSLLSSGLSAARDERLCPACRLAAGRTTELSQTLRPTLRNPPPLLLAGGGMSAEEIRAAMRAAEDEGDAAAAVAVEKEAAAELDEFTKASFE